VVKKPQSITLVENSICTLPTTIRSARRSPPRKPSNI